MANYDNLLDSCPGTVSADEMTDVVGGVRWGQVAFGVLCFGAAVAIVATAPVTIPGALGVGAAFVLATEGGLFVGRGAASP